MPSWTKDSLAGDTVATDYKTDTNLYAGNYMIRVVDANGCDVSEPIYPAPPVTNIFFIKMPLFSILSINHLKA